MQKKVVILGGGVAGMSAAHELIERGFDVEVYERSRLPGGKARSIPVIDSTGQVAAEEQLARAGLTHGPDHLEALGPAPTVTGNKPWVPGEHGFRFFPRFYKHVTDTMRRIPTDTGSVADNLVDTTRVLLAREQRPDLVMPSRFPRNAEDFAVTLKLALEVLHGKLEIPDDELSFFALRMWQFLTSCDQRRLEEYERISWWTYIGAEQRSVEYQRLLGYGITRSLVASQANLASTWTIGCIFLQLIFDILTPGASSDRVLDAPTNDAWLTPWLRHLVSRGVRYRLTARVTELTCSLESGSIQSATVGYDGQSHTVTGDYFLAAVPVEVMARLVTPTMTQLAPQLAMIPNLAENVAWMNGIQFYLSRDLPIAHGHVIFSDSPWALTAISQRQFWKDVDLEDYCDGEVRGIISVDISDWNTPGHNGKAAKDCSREEIKEEVWRQMKLATSDGGEEMLKDEHLDYVFLDPDITASPDDSSRFQNMEPLLVNLVDTWRMRPTATTNIPNLFLASDYVKTYTSLATMEAANEAARRAVNGILSASGSSARPCELWPLREPAVFAPWKALDAAQFARGLPWADTLAEAAQGAFDAVSEHADRVAGHSLFGDDAKSVTNDDCSPRGAVRIVPR